MSNQEETQLPLNTLSIKKKFDELWKELSPFNDLINKNEGFPAILEEDEVVTIIRAGDYVDQSFFEVMSSLAESLNNFKEMEKRLLEKKKGLSSNDLCASIQNGDYEKAMTLVKKGANLRSEMFKEDPICHAIRSGRTSLVDAIGEKYDIDENIGIRAIEIALLTRDPDDMNQCLIKHIGVQNLRRIIDAPLSEINIRLVLLWIENVKSLKTYECLFEKIGWDELDGYIPIMKEKFDEKFIQDLKDLRMQRISAKKKAKIELSNEFLITQ